MEIMKERKSEKPGWVGGWSGGFVWLLLLSIVWLVSVFIPLASMGARCWDDGNAHKNAPKNQLKIFSSVKMAGLPPVWMKSTFSPFLNLPFPTRSIRPAMALPV